MAADSEYARDHNRVENSENTNTIHRDGIVNHSHSQAQARIIGHPKSTHVQDINNALRHGTQVLTSIAKSTILPDMSQNISTGNAGGAGLSWNSYSPAKRRRIMSTGSSHSDKYAESDVDRFGDRESPGSISNRDCTVTRDSGRTTKSAFGFGGGDGEGDFIDSKKHIHKQTRSRYHAEGLPNEPGVNRLSGSSPNNQTSLSQTYSSSTPKKFNKNGIMNEIDILLQNSVDEYRKKQNMINTQLSTLDKKLLNVEWNSIKKFFNNVCMYNNIAKLELRQEIQKKLLFVKMHGSVGCGNKPEPQSIGMSVSVESDCINRQIKKFSNQYLNEFWSGHNGLDPDNPGILDILFSDTNGDSKDKNNNNDISSYFEVPYPNYKTRNKFDKDTRSTRIDKSLSNLENGLNDLIKRHIDERVLSLDICEHDYFDISQKCLGERLAHSLIIDHPFIMAPTGSSNTAGHDNMYGSIYSIQLQSHLRTFWQKIDNIGSSFNVRNVAIGGPVKQIIFMIIIVLAAIKMVNFLKIIK